MHVRYGMVGGGLGAFIGDVHRHAAMLDDMAILTTGCFSRNREKSLKTARAWNLPDPERVYGNYREMMEEEAKRDDGIDFVTIVTPNASHYEIAKCAMEHGIHVMCDKPLAINTEQALELQEIAKERDILFGITYAYTGYAAIRQGRDMIENGMIGDIIHVRTAHPEDWVIASVENGSIDTGAWRFDPSQIGESLCTGDLGSHAEQMLVQFTGLHVEQVLAMFDTYPADLPLETNVNALLKLSNGATGELWASQIAIGRECCPYIYVMGTEGSLEWHHETPHLLKYTKKNQTMEYLSAGQSYMTPGSNRLTRVPAGHHEGYYEAFGNIYRQFCEALIAKKEGRDLPDITFPTVDDGVNGQKFIAACVESQRRGNVWVDV